MIFFTDLEALNPPADMGAMVGGGASGATSQLTEKIIIKCKEAKVRKILLLSFVIALLCAGTGTSLAVDWGAGPGCSAIGDVDVTALTNSDTFTGRIGTTAVSGFNKQGKPADDSDGDGLTDSMEICINDALYGHCGDIDTDDSAAITVTPLATEGKNNNKQWFTVTFVDVSNCAVTQCSNNADDDGDGLIDYPDDPDCDNYSDNTEVP